MRVGGGCYAACFLRSYAGAPVTRTLRPSLLRCGERPCDTLRALPENTAHQPKHPATTQQAKRRQPPPPHTQNTQPPSNTLNRDSPPPPQFARHGAHILNHHATQRTGEIPRTPEPQMRRGIDIPRRDIRVSEAKRGRVPCRSKGKYLYLKPSKIFFRGNAKIPPIPKNQRDFL